jgi:hypothetical protein
MIMACLSKNPEKRPQNARAVAEWIGLKDSAPLPMTSFAPAVFNAPETSGSARETKKTTVAAAPAAESDAPPPAGENAMRRRLAMLVGSAGLGILAWLAWGHLIPKMPDLPAPLSAPKTNAINSAGTNVSTAAPIPAPSLAPVPPLSLASASIELGKVNRERGLREVTGVEDLPTLPANIGGKECRLLQGRPRARCYFQILPAFKHPGPMNARIQVEYYAASPGVLQLQFDGTARQLPQYTGGGRTNFNANGGWQTANYKISSALFRNGERGGADFRLTTSSQELYLHGVTVFVDQ